MFSNAFRSLVSINRKINSDNLKIEIKKKLQQSLITDRSSLETIIVQGPISVSRPNTSDTIQSEQPNEETDFEHGVDPLLQIHSDGNSANTIIQVNI